MATLAASFTRFKDLEAQAASTLPREGFHILRMDGRAFSTYTRGLQAPFDAQFAAAMDAAAIDVAKEFAALVTFVASDEISVIFAARTSKSQLPFGGTTAKVLSLAAARVTARFNLEHYARSRQLATFDARVVTVAEPGDVLDYLKWRQGDTYRNAVMMAAQTQLSHRELCGVGTRAARELLFARDGGSFETVYPAELYRGRQVRRTLTREDVTFVHTRTGLETTVVADRARWEATVAPSYRDLDPDAFVADLLS